MTGYRALTAGAVGAAGLAWGVKRALRLPEHPSLPSGMWGNWSRNQLARPAEVVTPGSVDELSDAIAGATGPIRPVGAGHSFAPLVPTEGTLVSLDRLTGVLEVDRDDNTAWVRAGTRLRDLSPELAEHGLALVNLGDIDSQSLAGAAATATHGTGSGLPSISAQITGVRLLGANGELRSAVIEEDPEFVQASQVSLGALGVLVDARLQLRPRYRLLRRSWATETSDALAHAERLWAEHRRFEFFVLPFSGKSLCITHDETELPATPRAPDRDDETLMQIKLIRDLFSWHTPTRRQVLRAALSTIKEEAAVGESWEILPSEREVFFNEMEYHMPAAHGLAALEETLAWIERNRPDAWLVVECRQTAGDDAWLSPFQGGSRISVAVHTFYTDRHSWFYTGVEPIFRRHGGRPHWGKLHSLTADDVRRLYPDLGKFLAVREELDPNGVFLNQHLSHLFGVSGGPAAP